METRPPSAKNFGRRGASIGTRRWSWDYLVLGLIGVIQKLFVLPTGALTMES